MKRIQTARVQKAERYGTGNSRTARLQRCQLLHTLLQEARQGYSRHFAAAGKDSHCRQRVKDMPENFVAANNRYAFMLGGIGNDGC